MSRHKQKEPLSEERLNALITDWRRIHTRHLVDFMNACGSRTTYEQREDAITDALMDAKDAIRDGRLNPDIPGIGQWLRSAVLLTLRNVLQKERRQTRRHASQADSKAAFDSAAKSAVGSFLDNLAAQELQQKIEKFLLDHAEQSEMWARIGLMSFFGRLPPEEISDFPGFNLPVTRVKLYITQAQARVAKEFNLTPTPDEQE